MMANTPSVSRPLIAHTAEVCEPSPGVRYDFARGVISVDRPGAKAVVGFADGNWRFSDGVSVDAGDCPFFCFGLVSKDAGSLAESRAASLTWGTYGENLGRRVRENPDEVKANVSRHAKLIASWGHGPPDIARPSLSIHLPWDAEAELESFCLEPFETQTGGTLRLPEGHRLFSGTLRR